MAAPKRKRGRPPLGDKTMKQVLFVRSPKDLLALLDRVVAEEKTARPGCVISRSDVARELLYAGCKQRLEESS